ncbi:MAG: hypothetical protein A3J37_07555 [Alphaproteobacteria bacterium RIFCSPHIGHO2_12_FULL_45_9]|nr:MAG: hypothetical protein A3B66_02150 [Alphaproteobacteria bacterium RIFCSPHIGHO2_02_FULL_46_13]OFW97977.1 MAG: hypothetical protein A3J37_07555 [Alphaproteobacteria bacterium RIFCSPHIGHO2_12_FULL_45_9]
MVVNKFRILSVAILCALLPFSAMAEEAAPATNASTPLTILDTASKDILKGLNENQVKQFSAINNSFGVIRTVEDVQQSIARAVESCGVANPDLKAGISGSFEAWKDTVRPVVKKARTKLDRMVLLQSFAPPSAVRDYLKKFDEAVIYRNQKINPASIQKAEDCLKLQSNMTKTQNDIVNMMIESLNLNSELKVKE